MAAGAGGAGWFAISRPFPIIAPFVAIPLLAAALLAAASPAAARSRARAQLRCDACLERLRHGRSCRRRRARRDVGGQLALQIFAAPGSEVMQHLPFAFVPTVLVPPWMIIHSIVFARLRAP
ncbi:MAG: hypothetical protein JO339_13330 [Alphaproteobacteria bacterium]|nr:hypothetical protein [Alphaproteobacteria bacterium]